MATKIWNTLIEMSINVIITPARTLKSSSTYLSINLFFLKKQTLFSIQDSLSPKSGNHVPLEIYKYGF